MISETYKGQYITASADYDPITASWIAKVVIFWSSRRGRQCTFLFSPGARFTVKSQAEEYGIQKGKEWIDRELTEV